MQDTIPFDPRHATLGEILTHVGVIKESQLAAALKECSPDQKNLGQVLVAMGFTTEEKILKAVSIRKGIPYFTSFDGMLEPEAADLIPETLARKYLAVPIFKSEDSLTVGMVNPTDIETIDELARRTGMRILPVMTTLANVFATVEQVYGGESIVEHEGPDEAAREVNEKVVRFQAEDSSVVGMVQRLLRESMSKRASDIHVEPTGKDLRVRFRVDGMLIEGRTYDKDMESALIARIKILAKMDITETRLPQDGHMAFDYGGRSVDIRVSSLPTVYGEKVVMRVLDASTALRKLSELGLADDIGRGFSAAMRRPTGMLLVTGPTGSGKTTTLYAALAELNEMHRNIVTLEDPVEYRLAGINQVQTHARIGMTFAAGLRSILRQDPNVVLVGEIRDLETAEIAMQAALTGHLVFSTLHTNDAVSTIHRLINMRVEPFLIAAALNGVLAQRLVRRLCDKCKTLSAPTEPEAEALGKAVKGKKFHAPAGCPSCQNNGYSGRLAIHEWLAIGRNVREMILKRASLDELQASARRGGLRSIQDNALDKASRGLTSLAEVIRVTREEKQD
ncbi:MAG: ATPase, T2SS/T4P/T4SS family [Elusimicrobiota bacterium]